MDRAAVRIDVLLSVLLRSAAATLVVALTSGLHAGSTGEEHAESRVDFAREIRPILARNCFPCHGPDDEAREVKLRLDTSEGATRDRGGYRAIEPGAHEESELWARITSSIEGDRMPPAETGKTLSSGQIDLLRRWIDEGARYTQHWAFVAPLRPDPPAVGDGDWPRNPIDRFVLARLEREGFAPAPEADRWTLARRLSLDLTGLPLTPAEARAFVEDVHPDAYERLVDRLMDSPHFGERWARMWLDLARYADSTGYGSDPLRSIWRWRDWVIDAFNANVPYDRFSTLQIAGDLADHPTTDDLLATAFHRNTMTNTEGGTDDEEFRVAAVKDRAEVTAQVWMGLTLGCAECHSHKFDPISHDEYYGFFAFFDQTEDTDKPDDVPRLSTPTREQAATVGRLQDDIAALESELDARADELGLAQGAWERDEADTQAGWRVLLPTAVRSRGGASSRTLDDGSILFEGGSPATDVVTLDAKVDATELSALRLEALPHTELPGGGPGRSPANGNFVLSEIVVRALPTEPAPARGRYLRIELPGKERTLSLAEVEVWSGGQNIAGNGTPSQSSVDYEGAPERAIDGNTGGVYADASVTHTRIEMAPWWELDFGRGVLVEQVRIFNRTDGELQERLAGARVSIFDGKRRLVWASDLRVAPRPSVTLAPGAEPLVIAVRKASADHEQASFEVARAIDGDLGGQAGWAIGPRQGEAHRAIFELEPLRPIEGRFALEIELHESYGGEHTLGRLRVSTTGTQPVPHVLPAEVERALALAPEARSADDRALLGRHWREHAPELAGLRERIAQRRAELVALAVPTTPIMRELPPAQRRTSHVLTKGNFLQQEQAVEPCVPAAMNAWPSDAPRDRAGLCAWIFAPENPLTARVAANRFWAQLFGIGLVETEEDFGTQGIPPSHPELLDWLAIEFRDGGWDMKAFLRTIVTSATYRQDARVTPELAERDPQNRLLARGTRFRLEAEMVRDQALAFAGLLSPKMYGPSVFPPQPDGMWQAAFNGDRTWATSSGEDRWRRGLYVFWRRTVPYPSMETFDAPSRETCTIRRIRTNTPLQAFVTLNDPVYVEAAQALARRIVQQGGGSVAERARQALVLCTGRPAVEADVETLVALHASELAHYSAHPEDALQAASDPLGPPPEQADVADLAAWTVVATVLLNLDAVLVRG